MKLFYTHLGVLLFGLIAGFLFCQNSCFKCPPCPETAVITPVKQPAPVNIPNVEPTKPIQPKKVIKPVSPKGVKFNALRSKTVDTTLVYTGPNDQFFEADNPCGPLWDEFNTVKFYSETYKDSAMSITVNDSVAMNKVFHQSVSYLRLLPDKNITVVKQFKYDVAVGIAFNTFSGLGFGAKVGIRRYEFLYRYYPLTGGQEAGVNLVLWRR